MRNIVFGDTGGWMPQLLAAFDELGIDAQASTMPKDLRVVHCGDLLHKGPFSSELLAIVTGLMVANPGQWIQLMGNHEAQHIPGAPRFWSCNCSDTDIAVLNILRNEGMMKPTHALVEEGTRFEVPGHPELSTDSVGMIFSHGGLTEGFWHNHASSSRDPLEVSRLLNEMPIEGVTAPGLMLGYNLPASLVGPVWAIGNTEVYESWKSGTEKTMPFTQFHGHTTSYSYDWKKWWPGLEEFAKKSTLIRKHRAIATELNNNLMLGVDPGFSEREPRIAKQPWIEFETKS